METECKCPFLRKHSNGMVNPRVHLWTNTLRFFDSQRWIKELLFLLYFTITYDIENEEESIQKKHYSLTSIKNIVLTAFRWNILTSPNPRRLVTLIGQIPRGIRIAKRKRVTTVTTYVDSDPSRSLRILWDSSRCIKILFFNLTFGTIMIVSWDTSRLLNITQD